MKRVKQENYPEVVRALARRRTERLLTTMTVGNCFRLNLQQIAESCYLQGLCDAAEVNK